MHSVFDPDTTYTDKNFSRFKVSSAVLFAAIVGSLKLCLLLEAILVKCGPL